MYLWVRLVLDSLESTYSPEELRILVDDLPIDLDNLYTRILARLCRVRGPQNYGGVPRMISWICFAQRPLHKYELLNGLAESPRSLGNPVQSIPIVQILDHCKPLVEVRPDSTVALVHFSVKEQVHPALLQVPVLTHHRFFLKSTAPQIITPMRAQEDMSFACTFTLMRGLDLLAAGVSELDNLVRVASGSYRLLPYASEFWVEHCLNFASTGGLLDLDQPISGHLAQLCNAHESHYVADDISRSKNSSTDAVEDRLDPRLKLFAHLPIHDLMKGFLHVRWLASQQNCDKGEGKNHPYRYYLSLN